MSELKYLNGMARRYAERRETRESRKLPDVALRDIQTCVVIDHLGYPAPTAVSKTRAEVLEEMGTEVVLWEIGQFYGFSPSEVQEAYQGALTELDRSIDARAS